MGSFLKGCIRGSQTPPCPLGFDAIFLYCTFCPFTVVSWERERILFADALTLCLHREENFRNRTTKRRQTPPVLSLVWVAVGSRARKKLLSAGMDAHVPPCQRGADAAGTLHPPPRAQPAPGAPTCGREGQNANELISLAARLSSVTVRRVNPPQQLELGDLGKTDTAAGP